ncbi:MAG: thiosulfate oxidation carrier complex protein SoxZ [Acidobacteria bacterium]|nr:thiosulfate oxidation carrier complex protein SoxZ [Acidobacteriota bacterium]
MFSKFSLIRCSLLLVLAAGGPVIAESPGKTEPPEQADRRLSALRQDVQVRFDGEHTPRIEAPRLVEVANEVQVRVSVPLLGNPGHYIRKLVLFDENSMVTLKYVATFSPAVPLVQVVATIKMAKNSRIKAIAECSLHGKWLGVSEPIRVGIGGCGTGQEPNRSLTRDVLRVRFEQRGQNVEMNLLFRHPMLSGYVLAKDGRAVRSQDPFFLRSARILYNEQTIADFELSPGLSENPRLGIMIPHLGSSPVKAEATNNLENVFTLLARMPR